MGRGSSGLGASGGGGSRSRTSAKMPELTGSEKQVKWAESIRSDALTNLNNLVKQASSEFDITTPRGNRVSKEAVKDVKDFITKGFQSVTDASKIIDSRRDFSYSNIKNAMFTADWQRKRKK